MCTKINMGRKAIYNITCSKCNSCCGIFKFKNSIVGIYQNHAKTKLTDYLMDNLNIGSSSLFGNMFDAKNKL